jgi:peptide/nickel transport system substrate-binding protein
MLEPDGSLGPALATRWEFTDDTLTTFELQLREGVKFSDGDELTADAVVDSIRYMKSANGPQSVYASTIESVEATGELTVVLHLTQPNPQIPNMLTQRFEVGDVISPTGLANPESLGTATHGAGPYVLDTEATVTGDTYAYVPNINYWNKEAIHFDSFKIRVIENPQTALDALKNGEISYTTGDFTTAEAADSDGLTVHHIPMAFYGAHLLDRDGAIVPALGDQGVRQALNYATDREGITKAVFGDYGIPTEQISLPGTEGYAQDYADHYSYDPDKAKELLAQAGYADGFEMPIGCCPVLGQGCALAQALASDWEKIGVKVVIDQYPTINALVTPWAAAELPALATVYDGAPMYIESGQILVPDAGQFNAFKSEDPELTITAWRTPNRSANAASNSATRGPIVKRLEATTDSIAASSRSSQVSSQSGYFISMPRTRPNHAPPCGEPAPQTRFLAANPVAFVLCRGRQAGC